MQQDELTRLFSANMNLSNLSNASTGQVSQSAKQVYEAEPTHQEEQVSQPITYISQHYTHSHHVVPTRNVAQEPTKSHIDASELAGIFLRNSIDPTLLFPSQIDLFQNADDDQRLRLLELWRISPPWGGRGHAEDVEYNTSRKLYDWPPTSLAQEEAMAKMRYEKMQKKQVQPYDTLQPGQHQDQDMDEVRESSATPATEDLLTASPESRNAEPYILSGYDMLAKREYEVSAQTTANHLKESKRYNQATDPVYSSVGGNVGLWDKNVNNLLDMENQYGAFAHARDYDIQPIYADDEMVM